MAITLPHIEDPNNTAYFPPVGNFETFQDDAHYEEKVREWGLSTTREVKKEFWYKEKSQQRLVTVKGYQAYGESGDYYTIIIEFQDGNLSCIHPAYLKEMQSPSFGKALSADFADTSSAPSEKDAPKKPVRSLKTLLRVRLKTAIRQCLLQKSQEGKTASIGTACRKGPLYC